MTDSTVDKKGERRKEICFKKNKKKISRTVIIMIHNYVQIISQCTLSVCVWGGGGGCVRMYVRMNVRACVWVGVSGEGCGGGRGGGRRDPN